MSTVTSRSGSRLPDALSVLDQVDIDVLPWRPVPGSDGVRYKELWRRPDRVCALIAYEPGAATPGLPHPVAEHHIWVTQGLALLGGRRLSVGSYVRVPASTAHRIIAGQPGCTLLQVHQ